MNTKRRVLAILGAFIAIVAVDFMTHEVLLSDFYNAHPTWWLPAPVMQARMPFMFASQMVLAILLTLIYAKGYEPKKKEGIGQGVRFGVLMGVLLNLPKQLMLYFVYPYPVSVLIVWGLGGLLETVLAGAAIGAIYKKKD